MGVGGQGVDLRGEGLDELQAALEPVPALDLGDDPRALGHRGAEARVRAVVLQPPERVWAAVLADEGHGVEGGLAVEEAAQARHGPGVVQVQHPVLGRVRVDGGGEDGAAGLLDVGRQVLRAGGDDQVDVLQVAVEEGPGPLPLLVGVRRAHVDHVH